MRRGSSRGTVAALVAALVVIAGLALLGGGGRPSDTDPSSRSAGAAGTLALYTWCDKLGFDVTRVTGSLDLSELDVLLLVEPTVDMSPASAATVTAFVRGGGDLVLATDGAGAGAAAALLRDLGVATAGATSAPAAAPAQPFDAEDRVHSVPLAAGTLVLAADPPVVPLLRARGETVAVGVRVGRGHAWVVGSPYPLSNRGLRQGDAAGLALSLLERARGGRLGFDEVDHGEGPSSGAAAILVGPVGLSLLLAVLVVLVGAGLAGRRLGRPLSAGDAGRVPSATAFVEAMGRLFARSGQRGAVAERYADELKQRVGAAAGADPHLDDAAFVAALGSHGAAAAGEVEAVLGRARALAAGRPSAAELTALARRVDEVEAAWAGGALAVAVARGGTGTDEPLLSESRS